MNKRDLVLSVQRRLDRIPTTEIDLVTDAVFTVISEALADGNPVNIRGFGSFSVSHVAERVCHLPTGDSAIAHAHNIVRFKQSDPLRKAINRGDGSLIGKK